MLCPGGDLLAPGRSAPALVSGAPVYVNSSPSVFFGVSVYIIRAEKALKIFCEKGLTTENIKCILKAQNKFSVHQSIGHQAGRE